MHYLLHGCHHKHPMDGLRLVFPPAATTILLVSFSNTVKLFSTPSSTPALFGGGLLGYVIYDCTHYYLHHGQPTNDVPKNLKGRGCLCSAEISHESSLPGARQGLWNHFIIMGQSVWNTPSIKGGKENVDNLIGSLAVNLARVRVEGLKFIFPCS